MENVGLLLPAKKMRLLPLLLLVLPDCGSRDAAPVPTAAAIPAAPPVAGTVRITPRAFPPDSWEYFLQHLPLKEGPVVDYTGHPVRNQLKAYRLVDYDVGSRDLQQCADALMRLRAEYLFSRQRNGDIGFHFTDGTLYTWDQYCKGLRPAARGNRIQLATAAPAAYTHESLRRYLDQVYMYAGTLSLEKELKKATGFAVGTVVIKGGSPGHCLMVVDEATTSDGRRVFRLAEGYSPAQSIYILANPGDALSPWYHLQPGPVETPSYSFGLYRLGRFE